MVSIKVILYGIGAIGSRIAKTVIEKRGLEVVGAIDVAPNKLGKDLGTVIKIGRKVGIKIKKSIEIIPKIKADIVIHSTFSYLTKTYPQIAQCIKSRLNVVSTCEELAFPYLKNPEIARKIDQLSKKYGVTVLGTGINPGFLMDTLPIILTVPCIEVYSIAIRRIMYSGNRRISYQKKIGTGMTLEKFNELMGQGKISGHVGLEESIAMIASALNWKLDKIQVFPSTPILTDKELETTFTIIRPNHVCGLKSIAQGFVNGRKAIILEFVSHAKIKKPFDSIIIKGTPNITQKIIGGINGDLGTVGALINAIPNVFKAKAGLITMTDLVLPSFKQGGSD